MEFLDVIKKRHSVRSYKPDPVEQEKLAVILDAAVLAPTAANRQAFKVIVIDTSGRKEDLKRIYDREWFSEAPLALCVCSIPGRCWVRNDQKNYSDVDAAIVMDHIILAATDQGLGTCWIAAFNLQAAKEVLGLDDSMEPVAFTPLGYAKETKVSKARKALDELVIHK
ncbi:MAG: nitroreductase family protein [Desulfotomaculaceae bacterium]|nr:nitroreductase family protein [Desulfotomaculaceae bacterium]